MSRVEDDREAARLAAKLAEARRNEEVQKNRKAQENSAFSKLVGKQKEQAQVAQQDNLARSAIAELLESAEAGQMSELQAQQAAHSQRGQESQFKSKIGAKAFEQKIRASGKEESARSDQGRVTDNQGQAQALISRAADGASAARAAEGRSGDAKVSREGLEERKEASDAAAAGRSAGAAAGKSGKGELKTDADKGGGGQQGGGKDQKDGGVAPGFRFNPALMAPVPVAAKKEATGSERLRKVANELAQKIVERVRIGTNAAGKVEFQVDLRSDVLAGLSVKVSANNGKITAVFQGSDKDVLKMLEEHEDALKEALSARGLKLEDFKIEART
ncbi:MAG: flagellar hook-length control protein FliK [Myxococcota bacterium]